MLTWSLGAAQRLTGSLLVCHPTSAWQLTDPTSLLAETSVRWQPLPMGLRREPNPRRKTGEGGVLGSAWHIVCTQKIGQPCPAPTKDGVQCNGYGEEQGMIRNVHSTNTFYLLSEYYVSE